MTEEWENEFDIWQELYLRPLHPEWEIYPKVPIYLIEAASASKHIWDIQQKKIDEIWNSLKLQKLMLDGHDEANVRMYNKLQIAIEALKSATNRSFYEGANKKECVDLCISWAKRVLEEVK